MSEAATPSATPRQVTGCVSWGAAGPGREMTTMPASVATMPAYCRALGWSPSARPHSTGNTAAPARMGAITLILVMVTALK